MVMSGLFQMNWSASALLELYSPSTAAPQELEWMRAPSS